MDSEHIKELWERYWQCETSTEEEAELRAFFRMTDVPEEWRQQKAWFSFLEKEKKIHLDEDFDRKVLERIEAPTVKARRLSLANRLAPLLKAASVVVVILSLGTMMRHTLLTDEERVIMPDTIGRQITTPSVAFSVEEVEGEGSQTRDSLQRMEAQPVLPMKR